MKKVLLPAVLALAAITGPAAAQNAPYRQSDSSVAPAFVLLCSNGADKAAIPSAVPCGTAANPVVVSGGTGGGGGGGAAAGSVTPAGTNGTTAQAVQGITGGVPIPTLGAQPTAIATGQVSCGTTAAQIVAARAGRRNVILIQEGTTLVRIGAAGVTTATGVPLPGIAYSALTLDGGAALYCVTASGTQLVSFVEAY